MYCRYNSINIIVYCTRKKEVYKPLTRTKGISVSYLSSRNFSEKFIPNLCTETEVLDKHLYIKEINKIKGKGLFSSLFIHKGQRITEFSGTLHYDETPSSDDFSYIYEFTYGKHNMWIDARTDDGSFGKFINDDVNPNCQPRVEVHKETPRIFFYAIADIKENEEIVYYYGKGKFPWRQSNEYDCEASNDGQHLRTSASHCEKTGGIQQTTAQTAEHLLETSYEHALTIASSQEDQNSKNFVKNDDCREKPIYVRLSTPENEHAKMQFCIYCLLQGVNPASFTYFSRHLFSVHKDELEVIKLSSFPIPSPERKLGLEKIRNMGNFTHNINVLKEGKGEIIPRICPSKFVPFENYVPCKHCKGFYMKKYLWKHNRKCLFNVNNEKFVLENHLNLFMEALGMQEMLQKRVYSKMVQDEITLIVKIDDIANRYAEELLLKLFYNEECHIFISQKLREIGKLMLTLRRMNSKLTNLNVCLNSTYFQTIVDATHEIAGFNFEKGDYKTPSLALKIGHTLNKCALIKEGMAIERHDIDSEMEAKQFSRSMELNWKDSMSLTAGRALAKSTVLLMTEDIKKLQ